MHSILHQNVSVFESITVVTDPRTIDEYTLLYQFTSSIDSNVISPSGIHLPICTILKKFIKLINLPFFLCKTAQMTINSANIAEIINIISVTTTVKEN